MKFRPTTAQLYNAAVAMNLAEGTPEHGARTQAFVTLFGSARLWTRLAVTVRVVTWRIRHKRGLRSI